MEADIPAVVAIERLSTPRPWSEAALRSTLSAASTLAYVKTIAAEPDDAETWAGEAQNPAPQAAIAGHVIATLTADSAEILLIAVHPQFRRLGLARGLLKHVLEAWDDHGIAEGWLEVRADNTPAIRLYESVHFHVSGRRPRYYADGTDALLMTRHRER